MTVRAETRRLVTRPQMSAAVGIPRERRARNVANNARGAKDETDRALSFRLANETAELPFLANTLHPHELLPVHALNHHGHHYLVARSQV
jgi:hypothetical protein